jgi:hypothetical protein
MQTAHAAACQIQFPPTPLDKPFFILDPFLSYRRKVYHTCRVLTTTNFRQVFDKNQIP